MDMGGPDTGEDGGEGGERTVSPDEHDNPSMLTPTVEKLVETSNTAKQMKRNVRQRRVGPVCISPCTNPARNCGVRRPPWTTVTGTDSSQGASSKPDDDTSFLQKDVLDVVPLAMSALGIVD